jgi:hypothetical protein
MITVTQIPVMEGRGIFGNSIHGYRKSSWIFLYFQPGNLE